jgi:transcription elongation factor Elf1
MVQAPGPKSGDVSIFERSCAYCGARLRVLTVRVPDENRTQDYSCPECGKSYETEAAAEPQVRLVKSRTDGKDDRYQETLF